MPGQSGEPVVTTLVCSFYFACEAAGALDTRHSLRPLLFWGEDSLQSSDGLRRENGDSRFLPSLHPPKPLGEGGWRGGVGGGGCFSGLDVDMIRGETPPPTPPRNAQERVGGGEKRRLAPVSSPANGSRECAADDWLRRVIQYSRGACDLSEKLPRTGYSAFAETTREGGRRRDRGVERSTLLLIRLLAADGFQLGKHRIDVEVVALLFARFEFRLFLRGLRGR